MTVWTFSYLCFKLFGWDTNEVLEIPASLKMTIYIYFFNLFLGYLILALEGKDFSFNVFQDISR